MISIIKVVTAKQLSAFVDFPHTLYKGDINYVPELHIAQKDLLTPGKHPFHDHSEMQLFLAYEGPLIKGRIAAILNNNHNKFKNRNDGLGPVLILIKATKRPVENPNEISSLMTNASFSAGR